MGKADKILSQMISNPRGKWRIEDIVTVGRACGLTVLKPGSGSHYKIAHPSQDEILTVPAHRPIKAVYIRKFVAMVRRVKGEA